MSLQQLKHDVTVITGASNDVGRAIARAFAEQGARVALLASDADGLEAAHRELCERGFESMVCLLDAADSNALDEAADRILAEWGQIDLWVNNAMISVFAPATKRSAGESPPAVQVNYLDHVQGTLAALRHMRQQNRGVILQLGSALGYQSVPLESAYSASKAAIRSFTDSLREQLIREGSGIAVTMLHLPAVNTPQSEIVRSRLTPHPEAVSPVYQPEVIAQAAVYAALHSKSLTSRVNAEPRVRVRSMIAPKPSARSTRRRTPPVVFAVLGLSAAALAFGPVRRWAREHARFLRKSP